MREMHRVGHYLILEPLGEGAMGRVYKARDTLLDRLVAIKTIRAERIVGSIELQARFEQEARVLASLAHPNIVALFDYGEEGGLAYFVMEYVDGQPLHLLTGMPPLELSDIFYLTDRLANALDYAHGKGIVHRDIKPGNVMIPRGNVVARAKLTDFGIAKLLGVSSLTQTGGSLGTIDYMSPEQVSEAPVDARTDLFALAVVVHELIAGNRPFEAETHAEILNRILFDTPSAPADIEQWDLSRPQWDNVFLRALAKDPEKRFQSAGAFARAIRHELIPRSGQFPTVVSAMRYTLVQEAEQALPEALEPALAAPPAPLETASREAVVLSGAALRTDKGPAAVPQRRLRVGLPSPAALMAGAALVIAIASALAVWRRMGPSPTIQPGAVSPEVVLVDSVPAGAEVILGGRATGMKTPVRIARADLERGGVLLRLECYEDLQVEPTNATHIAAHLVPLRIRTLVTTDPTGAEILLDDGSRLTSPREVKVPCGSVRKVRISKAGYRAMSVPIQSSGLTSETHLALQAQSPSMIELVSSHPYQIRIRDSAGAVVWQGRSPASVPVIAGSYLVRYESPDCADSVRESRISVAESQTLPFLLPTPARIDSITSEPRGAQILVDGRDYGERATGICLSPTVHALVAVWPDGQRAERNVTLNPGQRIESVVLRPLADKPPGSDFGLGNSNFGFALSRWRWVRNPQFEIRK